MPIEVVTDQFSFPEPHQEPKPPAQYLKTSELHWLKMFFSDGSYNAMVPLQWLPGAKRWCYPDRVGTGEYVDTKSWQYYSHLPTPPR